MTAPSKPEHLTWRIMVFQKETCQFKLLWPVTSSFGLIKISTVRNHHYTTGLIFWRILGIVLRHLLSLTCILCIKIKLQPELHLLSKGMRIAVRSGSIQRCRRTIRGVWVLANQKARLRSRAGFGRHTAFINEPCAIRKPDCIFLFMHTVVRSIECATSMI